MLSLMEIMYSSRLVDCHCGAVRIVLKHAAGEALEVSS